MSEIELVDFPGLGTLEAFNTDGLRSLLTSSKAPEMVEKTLRYPGHAEKMRMLRETGFLSSKGVLVASGQAVPRDITEALLFSAWQFEEGEPDLTVMRIVVEGDKEGKTVRHTYELLDYYNTETETSSMATPPTRNAATISHLSQSSGVTMIARLGLFVLEAWRAPEDCARQKP